MQTTIKISQKLLKSKLIELSRIKRELEKEKTKDRELIIKASTPKLKTDLLDIKTIKNEYGFCSRTIYRYRAKGLAFFQNSPKGFVYIVRENLENFIKQNRYD